MCRCRANFSHVKTDWHTARPVSPSSKHDSDKRIAPRLNAATEMSMTTYDVRPLSSDDFADIMRLEEEIFGDQEPTLGPYYVRLCCDFMQHTCFIARIDGEAVGYLLSFTRKREAYCTTLAVVPGYQGTRVVHKLIQAFVRTVINEVDACWFTVKEDNLAARAVHAWLGAKHVDVRRDFYGPGDERLVSRIDHEVLARLRQRYEHLGLLAPSSAAAPLLEASAFGFAHVRSEGVGASA